MKKFKDVKYYKLHFDADIEAFKRFLGDLRMNGEILADTITKRKVFRKQVLAGGVLVELHFGDSRDSFGDIYSYWSLDKENCDIEKILNKATKYYYDTTYKKLNDEVTGNMVEYTVANKQDIDALLKFFKNTKESMYKDEKTCTTIVQVLEETLSIDKVKKLNALVRVYYNGDYSENGKLVEVIYMDDDNIDKYELPDNYDYYNNTYDELCKRSDSIDTIIIRDKDVTDEMFNFLMNGRYTEVYSDKSNEYRYVVLHTTKRVTGNINYLCRGMFLRKMVDNAVVEILRVIENKQDNTVSITYMGVGYSQKTLQYKSYDSINKLFKPHYFKVGDRCVFIDENGDAEIKVLKKITANEDGEDRYSCSVVNSTTYPVEKVLPYMGFEL